MSLAVGSRPSAPACSGSWLPVLPPHIRWSSPPPGRRRYAPLRPISLPYRRYNDGLFPVDESLMALRAFEDDASAAIGTNGALVAHETSGRIRTLHFYVDSQTNALAEVTSHLTRWREGRASIEPQLDPAFEHVRHLTQ